MPLGGRHGRDGNIQGKRGKEGEEGCDLELKKEGNMKCKEKPASQQQDEDLEGSLRRRSPRGVGGTGKATEDRKCGEQGVLCPGTVREKKKRSTKIAQKRGETEGAQPSPNNFFEEELQEP